MLLLFFAAPAMAADRVPGEHWMRYADPADAGFDPAALEAAKAAWKSMPSSAFMVVADGAVVAAWGDVSRRFMCHSVRKSFLSALYGIYWDRGEIELNKTLADLGIDDAPDPLLPSERQARILDLLKARSGVFHPAAYAGRADSRPRGSEGPGRNFAYNNWDFNTLVTIFEQETGRKIFEAFDEHLARPLGMEDWRLSDGYYHYELDKSIHPAYPFRMSARDAARFGLLFTDGGMWGSKRILSRSWVNRSTAMYSIDDEQVGYGMLWWVFRQSPFIDQGMVAAAGTGGQMIAALPESGLVLVNRADTYDAEVTPLKGLLDLFREILEARTGEPSADPVLVPLAGSEPDHRLKRAPRTRLAAFVGDWPYPPPSFGLPRDGSVSITLDDDGLVLYSPVAGTFRVYLQDDGSLLEEDSLRRWVALRNGDGAVKAVADGSTASEAAAAAMIDGDSQRAGSLLALFDGCGDFRIELERGVLALVEGESQRAETILAELANRADHRFVEGAIADMGGRLIEAGRPDPGLALFELDTRLFPDSSAGWQRLGEALADQHRTDEAVTALSRAVELDEGNRAAREMLAGLRDEASPEKND